MLPRTTTLLTVLMLAAPAAPAAPAAALAHAGRVTHLHPHETPVIVALLLVCVGVGLLFRRRGAA